MNNPYLCKSYSCRFTYRRTMNKLMKIFVSVFLLAAASNAVGAIIEIQPAFTTASVGSRLNVDVVISDLENNSAPSLGGYDLNINYDVLILDFNGAAFGTGLDLFGFGTINGVTDSGGQINIFELSFDDESDLNSMQPDSFILASLSFDAISTGLSQLTLQAIDFADAAGDPLSIITSDGNVTINAASSVPETPTIWLFAVGLAVAYRLETKEEKV